MAVLRGGAIVKKEVPTGLINGTNKVYTTEFTFIPGTLQVFLNGLEQNDPNDFTETSASSFEFVNPPTGGLSPDIVEVVYQRD